MSCLSSISYFWKTGLIFYFSWANNISVFDIWEDQISEVFLEPFDWSRLLRMLPLISEKGKTSIWWKINQKTMRNETGPKELVRIFILEKYSSCKNKKTSEWNKWTRRQWEIKLVWETWEIKLFTQHVLVMITKKHKKIKQLNQKTVLNQTCWREL